MRKSARALGFSLLLLAAPLLVGTAPAFASAQIVVVNTDAPGVGFNDATPATPVGGNTGTTVGQQRLIAFQNAADIWGSILSSPVPIYIQASFRSLPCSATSGVLGAAAAIQVFANFPHAPLRNTWYPVALANQLAHGDLAPGDQGTDADDIIAVFNSDIGKANCIAGAPWYYGLDDNHGSGVDLVTVLLHEFGHGLGFAGFYDTTTGALLAGHPDVFSNFTYSTTLKKAWPKMTNGQRMAATIDSGHLVWTGKNVTAAAKRVLQAGTPLVTVNAPASLGAFAVGTATFGPALTSPGVKGFVVNAKDADGATEGCSPITNNVNGKIALIDRGTCNFTVKVKNAQDAGAVGVIIVNNAPGSPPPGLSGTDATITIPTVLVTQADGNKLRAAAARGKAQATVGVNPKVLAGANPQGQVLLFAPNPVSPGSSYSHWDISAFPNLLMEPAINSDLPHDVDLTRQALLDMGWTLDGNAVADEATAAPSDGSP